MDAPGDRRVAPPGPAPEASRRARGNRELRAGRRDLQHPRSRPRKARRVQLPARGRHLPPRETHESPAPDVGPPGDLPRSPSTDLRLEVSPGAGPLSRVGRAPRRSSDRGRLDHHGAGCGRLLLDASGLGARALRPAGGASRGVPRRSAVLLAELLEWVGRPLGGRSAVRRLSEDPPPPARRVHAGARRRASPAGE